MNTLDRVRRLLLGLLLIASVGTGVELVLLEHYEELWQFTPLVLLGVGAMVTVWHFFETSARSARVLQGTMFLFIAAGVLGLFFHYESNAEFALEVTPALSGTALIRAALIGGNPALAPAMMIQLGLIGLIATYGRD